MHCSRNSGVVSTSTRDAPVEITTEGRVRLSRGSVLVHTSQWHPIIGMPALVPVPRKSSSTWLTSRGYTDWGRRVIQSNEYREISVQEDGPHFGSCRPAAC